MRRAPASSYVMPELVRKNAPAPAPSAKPCEPPTSDCTARVMVFTVRTEASQLWDT